MDGPARITDVAQAAGVSATTVSNVLNRPHKVAAGTREIVQKVIQNLEYVPNPNAAALPKRRQKQDLPEVTSETEANPSRLQTLLEAPSSSPIQKRPVPQKSPASTGKA
ncbi:LacI family DNA-binding transcriptional regulator [Arthrobacter sp. SD76]|uniref:LacI family DNA-binding transcriptional regulator n=1 Tax=Arthrobacter sp. SD76 TaxID=3415007 RepID=UPI003C7184FB